MSAQGQEAYAVLSGTSLTFYYDNNKASRSGTKYDLSHNSNSEPQWYGKRTSITKVTFDPSFADARPTDTSFWFCEMSRITGINGLSNLNTSEVTDMSSMFESCTKITSIDLSTFNTEKVEYMNSMFYKCTGLTSLDLSAWKLPKLYSMAFMFYQCSKLQNIAFSQTNGNSAGHSLFCTFYNCSNLESIDLSHFDAHEVISMNGMCYNCQKLNT
ncbi:MAG: BspA family leucine-rich repeat surface protein, partial [Bacteroidaceae bacterium]|nr:BspA family leucine-rich repeat surface protein [Bacteroidaceae bacterium]